MTYVHGFKCDLCGKFDGAEVYSRWEPPCESPMPLGWYEVRHAHNPAYGPAHLPWHVCSGECLAKLAAGQWAGPEELAK